MEIHGSYLIIYVVGIVLMIINIIQCICRPKGKFFNPPQMEDKTVRKMRTIYGVFQSILLILFVICFVKFKSYVVAIIGLSIGNILPIMLVFLYDSYLNIREREGKDEI